jgi:cytochrome b561
LIHRKAGMAAVTDKRGGISRRDASLALQRKADEMIETAQVKYDGVAMLLHWIIAVLMIFMIIFGEDLMGEKGEAGEAAAGTFLPSVHVSIGVTILALTLLRLIWRLMNPPPPYPASMKPWEVTMSKVTHGLFYVLMIGLPLTGWLAFAEFLKEAPAMSGVSVFGLFPVPAAPQFGELAKGAHGLGSNVAMVLVILHVLAALKHQFIDGDGIFRRMLPG